MGRERKFRIWDPATKIMDYDPCIKIPQFSGGQVKIHINGCLNNFKIDCGTQCEFPGYIFDQYTGLKDKNGVEIYENDIVNICGIACTDDSEMACIMDTNSVVFWDKRYARFDVKDKPESKDWDYRRRRYYLFTDKDREDIEVIGNVHENKELLDKNDKV